MTTTTPRDLAARLADLLRREHSALADFLVALADFDNQRGWRDFGYAGLFPFLHRELQLSKAAAYFRKTGADLVRRFPQIVEPIRDGRLCLTSVVELSKVLTPENFDKVLPRFFHCSKQEAKAITAAMVPQESPARRTVVTTLSTTTPTLLPGSASAHLEHDDGEIDEEQSTLPATLSQTVRPGELECLESSTPELRLISNDQEAPRPAPHRDTAEPLTADLRRLHVTVSRRFLEKLDAARAALSHSHPGARTEDVLEAALDLVLEKDAKKKGLVAKPRPAGPTPPPRKRYVPAAVRREVW